MITLDQYAGPWSDHIDFDAQRRANAEDLLIKVEALMEFAKADGIEFLIDPDTGSHVGGEIYGGFRPQSCPIGAPNSKHKQGQAVDIYDPDGKVDAWCMANLDRLRQCGIYLEHPDFTKRWSHWQSVAPGSGTRVFKP